MPDNIPQPREIFRELFTVENPEGSSASGPKFGSDAIADTIRSLDIPFIAINPGASFRGLHDSIVNYLDNQTPKILLCLHEESAVAIAHGYAKVTGKPMLAAVHSNVGLMHATMAVFNAWCDRVPLILLGATGPVDAVKRRPWIEWIHTARDQGALVRHYVKWDDQPASIAAAQEAILRGAWLSSTAPCGPVYINLDVEIQEERLEKEIPAPDPARFIPHVDAGLSLDAVKQAAALLEAAQRPVILMGRMSRDEADWQRRVQLAEALGARVVTNLKLAPVFPTRHDLHAGAPASFIDFIDPDASAAIADADVVIGLEWVDLAGTLKIACKSAAPDKTVINVSLDHHLHNGWSMDYQALPAVDLFLASDPDCVVEALLEQLATAPAAPSGSRVAQDDAVSIPDDVHQLLTPAQVTLCLRHNTEGRAVCLLHVSTSWNGADWPFSHPMDYIGSEAGGGIGGGPGIAVGAALALSGSGRLPVAVVGDGDFLMGATALWTATHYRISLLVVVVNNQSFFNDEVHQQVVAQVRGRPVANKWIGQRMTDPEIDLAQMAEAQGALGLGPIKTWAELDTALQEAIAHVDNGGVAVVDARVLPGFTSAMRERTKQQ